MKPTTLRSSILSASTLAALAALLFPSATTDAPAFLGLATLAAATDEGEDAGAVMTAGTTVGAETTGSVSCGSNWMTARRMSIQEEKLERTMSPATGCHGFDGVRDEEAAARL